MMEEEPLDNSDIDFAQNEPRTVIKGIDAIEKYLFGSSTKVRDSSDSKRKR